MLFFFNVAIRTLKILCQRQSRVPAGFLDPSRGCRWRCVEFARHFGPAGQLCVVAGNCFFQVQRNCSSGKRSQVQMPCVVRSSQLCFYFIKLL